MDNLYKSSFCMNFIDLHDFKHYCIKSKPTFTEKQIDRLYFVDKKIKQKVDEFG